MRRATPWIAIGVITVALIPALLLMREYWKMARWVDQQLAAGPFVRTFSFYAAPEQVSVGDALAPVELAAALGRAGYKEAGVANAKTGNSKTYRVEGDAVTVWPEAAGSPPASSPIVLRFAKGQLAAVSHSASKQTSPHFEIDPQLLTNLSGAGRERRVLVHYADLPPVLVHAVVSAEDKRFFEHAGFDPLRIAKAVYVDVKDNRKEQGASTLTMQLARNLWLDREKNWKRKMAEALITAHLERKLSKERIFEYYANQVYLGGKGTFGINGFGAAAKAYFNKDVRRLNLPEAALLAGLIQRPSYFNPFRYPERALERRNLVLQLMRENGYIGLAESRAAAQAPLGLTPESGELSGAQYFLDLASDELQRRVDGQPLRGVTEVYTPLDLRLQEAAERAVHDGAQNIDKVINSRRKHKNTAPRQPQIALIALDPRTGEVKALVGGRNYSASQLNHALSKRPPGSVFKPFVYAAALNTAVEGGLQILTPASTVQDVPTTFRFASQTYAPDNFEHVFHGTVTLKQAMAKSMNVAAVRVGQMAGYDSVVALAKRAGMNGDIRATPAVALGAYDATPLEIAGAYTIFANQGLREPPAFISAMRQQTGRELYRHEPESGRVLDSRVAFLMVDMLQEVMRTGTAAGVRARGFKLPAAGKTGTSHDGWFAGFTSNLLCVVWVGFDDYSNLDLEGARSALPIWTQFMQEAARHKQFGDVKPFNAPDGVVRATVDPVTGKLATPYCPWSDTEYFVDGSQPSEPCPLHSAQPAAEANVAGAPITVVSNVSNPY